MHLSGGITRTGSGKLTRLRGIGRCRPSPGGPWLGLGRDEWKAPFSGHFETVPGPGKFESSVLHFMRSPQTDSTGWAPWTDRYENRGSGSIEMEIIMSSESSVLDRR
jgi:hypothetical protein